jgi:hypothetical protein
MAVTGILSAVVGVVMLFWAGGSAKVVAAIFAIWLIVAGIVNVGIGIATTIKSGWARAGYVILGLLYIVSGILFLLNLPVATAALAVWLAILIGVMWIFEGIHAFTAVAIGTASSWNILYGLLSVIAGVVLVLSPGYIAIIWWLLAATLIILGVVQFVRSFTFAKE